ncbi:hypothetical protein FF1_018523 [Malus domestica]
MQAHLSWQRSVQDSALSLNLSSRHLIHPIHNLSPLPKSPSLQLPTRQITFMPLDLRMCVTHSTINYQRIGSAEAETTLESSSETSRPETSLNSTTAPWPYLIGLTITEQSETVGNY